MRYVTGHLVNLSLIAPQRAHRAAADLASCPSQITTFSWVTLNPGVFDCLVFTIQTFFFFNHLIFKRFDLNVNSLTSPSSGSEGEGMMVMMIAANLYRVLTMCQEPC